MSAASSTAHETAPSYSPLQRSRVWTGEIRVVKVAGSGGKSPRDTIHGPHSSTRAMAAFNWRGATVESFWCLYLDGRHKPIGWQEIARGGHNVVHVSPRETFTGAMLVGATTIIIAHNHPTGDSSPSADDEALTERIRSAGAIVGVTMLDHIILAEDNFYSFAEMHQYAFDAADRQQ